MRNIYCQLIAMFFLGVASQWATASQFTSQPTNVKIVAGSTADMLVPATPNSGLISYSKFTGFLVDRPLKIINTIDTHSSIRSPTAKLIIIEASSINLRSNIEIVGETADLLIVNRTSGVTFSCTNCSFTNIGRVTLATAIPTFDSLYNPGDLAPVSSSLRINGLSTDRVASLELIGQFVSLSGLINTQARGSQLSDGSYQLNPSGGLIIGAGGVNVFSGLVMSYPTLSVGARKNSSALSFTSGVQIASQAVHISTAAPFTMGGVITTKSDVATAVNYRGSLSAVEESIKIYSFSDSGSLIIGGMMHSDNLIDVRSSSDLVFNGNMLAAGLIGIAGGKLTHNAMGTMSLPGKAARWTVSKEGNSDIVKNAACATDQPADTTKALVCLSAFFSAGSIDNNGSIKGQSVLMAAINELQNRYGGKILADNIQLSSQTSFVRNGSKYPFKPAVDQPKIFAPIDPNNIPLGTVTIDGAPFLAAGTGASKVDTTALVLGKNITIVASGNVENVNPYVELTTTPEAWINGVVFSPAKSARVQILADNNLKIGSSTYLLNSSAYMGVGNPGGSFFVSAPSIANQRYSTQAAIQPYSRTVNSVTTTGTEAALMVYSPPGVIYSFSPLTFNLGAAGNFVNNTSYFEVLNDATFSNLDVNRLINIGLNVHSVVNTSVNNLYVSCMIKIDISGSDETAGRRIAAEQEKCNASYGGTTVAEGTVIEAQQGTLFSVKGNVNGEKSDLFVTNHDVMTEMKNQVIADYILAHTGVNTISGSDRATLPVTNGGNISYDYASTFKLSLDGTSFLSNYVVTSADTSQCGSECISYRGKGVIFNESSESVADVLARKFAEMKALLIEAINKLMALLS